jgi:hypothetical protein
MIFTMPKTGVSGYCYVRANENDKPRVSLTILSRLAQHLYTGGSRATFGAGN